MWNDVGEHQQRRDCKGSQAKVAMEEHLLIDDQLLKLMPGRFSTPDYQLTFKDLSSKETIALAAEKHIK